MNESRPEQQLEELLTQDEHGVPFMYEVPLAKQVAVALNGISVPYAAAQVAHLQSSTEVPLAEQPMHFVANSAMRERYAYAMRPVVAEVSPEGSSRTELYMHDTNGVPELYHVIGSRMLAVEFVPLSLAENELLQVQSSETEQLWYLKLWAAGAEHVRNIKEAVQQKHAVTDLRPYTYTQKPMHGYSSDLLRHLPEPTTVAAKAYFETIRSMHKSGSYESQAFIKQPMQQAVETMFLTAIQKLTHTIQEVYRSETVWDVRPQSQSKAHEAYVQQVRSTFLGDVRFANVTGYEHSNAVLVPTAVLPAITSEGIFNESSCIARSAQQDFVGIWLNNTYFITAAACSVMPGMSWLRVDELRQDLSDAQKNETKQIISEHLQHIASVSFI